MKIYNPHDSFFKEMFSQPKVTRGFIENYLPQKIVTNLDLTDLKPVKDSFIDNELKNSQADLLFNTKLKNTNAYIYILFEHKSQSDKWVAFQLLRYLVRIWEKYLIENKNSKKLPVILPILFYHGENHWEVSTKIYRFIYT
ncbi:MAG: Rpn family recombination-promoting nuclease/putative transposase [Leptonema sp. (in: Bacteria)]|nr:Rpn family recombination-promoting nuclease/putative transposase [Leptonema sp. (in: bacteria)]